MQKRKKGDNSTRDNEPPGGRAEERLRQFQEQRGYPVTPEKEPKRRSGRKGKSAQRKRDKE